jgi:hypothetical protein
MKKMISVLVAVSVVLLSFLLPVHAGTMNPTTTSGSMEISTTRVEEIEISFPANVSIPWNTTGQYDIGEISAEKMVIAPNKKVVVTITSQNNSKFVGDNGNIPYVLGVADAVEFTELNDNSVFPLKVSVAQRDWDNANAGGYKDVLTFTMEYVNK